MKRIVSTLGRFERAAFRYYTLLVLSLVIAALVAMLGLSVRECLADVIYHGTTGQTLYVRIQTGASTFVGIAMTEGSSGGLGVYKTTDAAIVSASITTSSAGAGFANGYPFTVRSGSPSDTANDTIVATGQLCWSGSVELPTAGDVYTWRGSTLATPDTNGYPKVTIKSGTGTGEVSLASGIAAADVRQWNSSNIATPDTAGYPKVTLKNGTGTGEISLGSGTVTVGTMSAAVIDNTTFAPGAIDSSALAADAIGASQIAASAVGASEIAADAIGASEIAADAIASSELAATAVDEVWDELQSGHTTPGTFGKFLDDEITDVSGGGGGDADDFWSFDLTTATGIADPDTAAYKLVNAESIEDFVDDVAAAVGDVALTDSDFEDVPDSRMFKLVTNSNDELVGDKTRVLNIASDEKTFAVDFKIDLGTNRKINTVGTPTIATGTTGGVTFGDVGRERSVAKIRIEGVTAGTYVINVPVTYDNGIDATGRITLKVVE